MEWGEFMRGLAKRVVEEHCAAVERDCKALSNDPSIEPEDVADLCHRLTGSWAPWTRPTACGVDVDW